MCARRVPIALVGVLIAAALLACGGHDHSDLPPSWVETDVLVADVDADGRADVLTLAQQGKAGQWEGYLLIYRQIASSAFAAPTMTVVGSSPWQLDLADLSGDGKPDAVITDPEAGTVWMLTQDGAHPGTFLAPQAFMNGGYEAVIADLNGDGALDVAVIDGSSPARGILVRYQDSAKRGIFGLPVAVVLPGRVGNLVAGDVDGDGRADLLAWIYVSPLGAYPSSGGIVALFQQPGGEFLASEVLAPQTGMNVDQLAIADANGDGRPDLLASLAPSSIDYKAKLVVVPQSSTRGFGAPVYTSLANLKGNLDAVFADLNGDGIVDAALAGFWPESGGPLRPPIVRSRTNLLFNDGRGAFLLAAEIEMPVAVSLLTSGDLDGDGRDDIVVYGDEQCLVMFQSHTVPGTFEAVRPLR